MSEILVNTTLKEAFAQVKPGDVLVLKKGKTYTLEKEPIVVGCPVVVEGNGAILDGSGAMNFVIVSGKVTFKNVNIKKSLVTFLVDGHGQKIENIEFDHCYFEEIQQSAIFIGSTESNSTISGVHVHDCEFVGTKDNKSFHDYGGTIFIAAGAVISDDTKDIDNCVFEKFDVHNNYVHGGNRVFVNFMNVTMLTGFDAPKHNYKKPTIKDVHIYDNVCNDSFDPVFNFICGGPGRIEPEVYNVEINNNKMKVGLWSVYIAANEPIHGHGIGGYIHDVNLHDNEVDTYEQGVGEPTFGMAVQVGRIDYVEGIVAEGGVLENLTIKDNTFKNLDNGILLNAANSLMDAPTNVMKDNVCRNVLIEGNKFYDVGCVFRFSASNHEGRRVDWNIGVPPHEVVWGELLEDPSILTVISDNNILENVLVKNNFAKGYSFKYKCAAVRGFGQGKASNNILRVQFENNHYEHGEGHVSIKDFDCVDYVIDGGGNSAFVKE